MNILTSIPSKFIKEQKSENLRTSNLNYGNQVFWGATIKLLEGHNLFSIFEDINESIDCVVYVLANSIQEQTVKDLMFYADSINYLNCPKTLLSIGAQHKNDDMFKFSDELKSVLNLLFSQMEKIYLRGNYTQKLLLNNGIEGQYIVNGCPSIFLNKIPTIELKEDRIERILINMPRFGQLPSLFGELNAMATDPRVTLVSQDNIYYGFYGQRYKSLHPKSIGSWRDFLKDIDFTIGTRVHGSIMSLLCGIPTLCLCWDSRTTELCKEMEIPHIIYKEQRFNNLDELLNFARENYKFDRVSFDKNLERLKKNLQKLDFINMKTECKNL